jgi:hypothetical protein
MYGLVFSDREVDSKEEIPSPKARHNRALCLPGLSSTLGGVR